MASNSRCSQSRLRDLMKQEKLRRQQTHVAAAPVVTVSKTKINAVLPSSTGDEIKNTDCQASVPDDVFDVPAPRPPKKAKVDVSSFQSLNTPSPSVPNLPSNQETFCIPSPNPSLHLSKVVPPRSNHSTQDWLSNEKIEYEIIEPDIQLLQPLTPEMKKQKKENSVTLDILPSRSLSSTQHSSPLTNRALPSTNQEPPATDPYLEEDEDKLYHVHDTIYHSELVDNENQILDEQTRWQTESFLAASHDTSISPSSSSSLPIGFFDDQNEDAKMRGLDGPERWDERLKMVRNQKEKLNYDQTLNQWETQQDDDDQRRQQNLNLYLEEEQTVFLDHLKTIRERRRQLQNEKHTKMEDAGQNTKVSLSFSHPPHLTTVDEEEDEDFENFNWRSKNINAPV